MTVLLSWIGFTDLQAARGTLNKGLGPIAQVLQAEPYEQAFLLSSLSADDTACVTDWLTQQVETPLKVEQVDLENPSDHAAVYEIVREVVGRLRTIKPNAALVFNVSAGTPAMHAVWLLVSRTIFPARLVGSSLERGAQPISLPFEIAVDYLPDEALTELSQGRPLGTSFDEIEHVSPVMQDVLHRAAHVAGRTLSVLIQGETGTGKELLAQAIHRASPRKESPFVAVNVGALPKGLVDATLFGYAKGAFTGAVKDSKGYFESAKGGTLFLDELGEMPLSAQVALLRVLETGRFRRVGESEERQADVRIISATHRDLWEMVADGSFREDLFYRLAIVPLKLPALRERRGAVQFLAKRFWPHIVSETHPDRELERGASALNRLKRHHWTGNVRELRATLVRAALWCVGESVDGGDIERALLTGPPREYPSGSGSELGEGFSIDERVAAFQRPYLRLALERSGGNKSEAARLLGLKSHQVLSSRVKKFGL